MDEGRRREGGWDARARSRGPGGERRADALARIRAELAAAAPGASAGPAAAAQRRETVYRPARPLDVRQILSPLHRGGGNPCFRIERSTGDTWLTVRTAQGGATLAIRAVRSGARAVAFGPGADAAIEAVPQLLGAGDDWSELHRMLASTAAPGWLRETARRNPGLLLTRTGAVLDALAPAVLEQRITGVEARRALAVLHARYGEPAPGPPELVPPRMRLPLTPAQWRSIPAWEWHRAGVDPARARTIAAVARVAPSLERLANIPREAGAEARRALCSIPGVGEWTAAEAAQRALGDPDAPSFGDYHLAAAIAWAFTGADGDDATLRELLAPWPGHRQRIVRLALISGRDRPRGGPRLTIEDHRGR